MSTRDLVNAIIKGDSLEIENALNQTLAEKISVKLQEARIEYSRKMFRANASMDEQSEEIEEVLGKSAEAGEWINDFVHSDNPKFKGKSKEKRKQMALAAYYAKQREK